MYCQCHARASVPLAVIQLVDPPFRATAISKQAIKWQANKLMMTILQRFQHLIEYAVLRYLYYSLSSCSIQCLKPMKNPTISIFPSSLSSKKDKNTEIAVQITPISYIRILFVRFYLDRLSLQQIIYPSNILRPDKVSKRSNMANIIANVFIIKTIEFLPSSGKSKESGHIKHQKAIISIFTDRIIESAH